MSISTMTMTTQEMISQLNESLITEQPDIKIIDYVKLLNEKIFNIGIDFIDDFINLVEQTIVVLIMSY